MQANEGLTNSCTRRAKCARPQRKRWARAMTEGVTRPWTVLLGCAVSLAISVWDIATSVSDEGIVESRSFLMLLLVLSMIPVFFTLAAFFGRNWARIALALLTALSIASVPLFGLVGEEMAVPLDAETMLYAFADIIVIVLLFVPASNAWYRRVGAESA